ncbi:glutathione S-transferase [Deltaproteobacteria bacterium]|nr:glutathione S-transferase [Deltaproteobacteria bacterium]
MATSLTYFNFDGSRGQECRLALAAAGIPFEDIRLDRPEWMALKPTTPYGALPILTEDGRTLAQSNAILAYVGRKHGLHPADPWAAAEHEAVMQSCEDLRYKVALPAGLSDEDKRTTREAFASGWLATWAATISGRVAGPFLEGAAMSVADIKLAVVLKAVLAGTYDHIPGSTLDAWPKLRALVAAVEANPGIAAFVVQKR